MVLRRLSCDCCQKIGELPQQHEPQLLCWVDSTMASTAPASASGAASSSTTTPAASTATVAAAGGGAAQVGVPPRGPQELLGELCVRAPDVLLAGNTGGVTAFDRTIEDAFARVDEVNALLASVRGRVEVGLDNNASE